MKKIILSSIISVFFFTAFAFQGVIEQTYTDAETMEQTTFIWTIDGEKICLDIKTGEESMTIIPNFADLSFILFGDKSDNEGNFWYSKSALKDINVNVPKLRVIEKNDSEYKGEAAKEIKLMGPKGLVVIQFLESIDVNMKNMNAIFAESVEFNGINLANESGFPVSSMLLTENDAIYTLTTQSITAKIVDNSTFKVPSNYKLFIGIK